MVEGAYVDCRAHCQRRVASDQGAVEPLQTQCGRGREGRRVVGGDLAARDGVEDISVEARVCEGHAYREDAGHTVVVGGGYASEGLVWRLAHAQRRQGFGGSIAVRPEQGRIGSGKSKMAAIHGVGVGPDLDRDVMPRLCAPCADVGAATRLGPLVSLSLVLPFKARPLAMGWRRSRNIGGHERKGNGGTERRTSHSSR